MSVNPRARIDPPIRWAMPVIDGAAPGPGFHLPVGTVTLLLADIEGSTRRWQDEPEAMGHAVAAYDELITDGVGRNNGVRPIEQGEGDSFVAAFSRASDGLACALELQRALAGGDLHVRMALHTGEVQLRNEGNYIGTAINRCGRIRALAHGGQTLLSRTTHDLVADRLPDGVTLVDLGAQRLRDLARPEHVFQLDHPDLVSDFPPLRSLDEAPNNLPAQLTTLIGRDAEVAELDGLLPEARLLTLVGSGGCGKTRLALQVAADALDAFPDGVWFVDLAPISDPEAAGSAVAHAVGIAAERGKGMADVLVARFKEQCSLLVLDNCEHLVDACAALAVSLLRGCPTLTILATSREALGVDGERRWRVPSLNVPSDGEPMPIEALAAYDAVRLFIDRAVRARPNFVVTNENAPAVAAVCCRLDGIPLAIELAAARVRALSPEQIASGLADRFHVLGAGARTTVARQQTLRASVDWSYQLLSEPERALVRRLAVFAGEFGLDAAEMVGSGAPIATSGVLELLISLVDKSLVIASDGVQTRYRLLETIRQFGLELLHEGDEYAGVADQHLAAYLDAFPAGTDQNPAMYNRVRTELHNLRAALERALSIGQGTAALQLCQALFNHWWSNYEFVDAHRCLTAALVAGADSPPALRAIGMSLLSVFAGVLDGFDRQGELVAEAEALAERSGDVFAMGAAATASARFLMWTDPASSIPVIDRAIALWRRAGAHWWEGEMHRGRATAMTLVGDFAAAATSYARLRELSAEAGDEPARAETTFRLGVVNIYLADYEAASTFLEDALESYRAAESPGRESFCLFHITELHIRRGDLAAAVAAAELSVRLAASLTSPERIDVYANVGLGRALLATGEVPRARKVLEEWLLPWRRAGNADMISGIGRSVAEACLLDGDAVAARAWCADLLGLARGKNDAPVAAAMLHAQGLVEHAAGDVELAENCFRESLALASACGDPAEVADALEAIGGCAAAQESYVEGARLLAAGVAAREAIGYARFPTDQPRFELAADSCRTKLGDEAFAAAWSEGTAMSTEEAVAYVERGRGERKRPSVGWGSLTPTESSVVELIAEGLTNPQICERLLMSRSTVKTHLTHVFEKLGVATRSELAAQRAARASA